MFFSSVDKMTVSILSLVETGVSVNVYMNMPKTKSGCSSYDFENVIENLATFVCADCFEEVHQQFFGNLHHKADLEKLRQNFH